MVNIACSIVQRQSINLAFVHREGELMGLGDYNY